VIPGDPRTVVMLSRYQADPDNESLAQLGHEGRVAEVRALEDFIDEQYGARDANLAIALRDARGYRTVGVRPVDREIDVQDGDDLDLAPLERLLAARPGVDPLPPPIEPDGVVSGMIVGPPRAPVAYRLTLGAPARVLTELSVPSALDDPPMLAICRGVVRPARCVVESLDAMELDDELDLHDELSPGPVRDEVMRSAYGLPAGIYTVAIDSPCDPGDPCPADGAAFTLRLRTLRRED